MRISAVHGHGDQDLTLTLTLPDSVKACLQVNDAEERIQLLLGRELKRIEEIVLVCENDHRVQLEAHMKRSLEAIEVMERGPDQIAFAGSKEPAIEVPVAGGPPGNLARPAVAPRKGR
jgi:hypothetical protein